MLILALIFFSFALHNNENGTSSKFYHAKCGWHRSIKSVYIPIQRYGDYVIRRRCADTFQRIYIVTFITLDPHHVCRFIHFLTTNRKVAVFFCVCPFYTRRIAFSIYISFGGSQVGCVSTCADISYH